jgi:hypothetical protein
MAAASDFATVVYLSGVVTIRFDATILTNWDIARVATILHLGRRRAEDIPAVALSLRGPVTADSIAAATSALAALDKTELAMKVDTVVPRPWFLLEIDLAPGGSAVARLMGVGDAS